MAIPKAHGSDQWGDYWYREFSKDGQGIGLKYRGVEDDPAGGHRAYSLTGLGDQRIPGSGFRFKEMPGAAPVPTPAPAPAPAPASPAAPPVTATVARGVTDTLNASAGTTGSAWMGDTASGGRNRNSIAALRSRAY